MRPVESAHAVNNQFAQSFFEVAVGVHRDLIFPHLRPVVLPLEAIVYKAEEPIERVYFPHAGIVSLIVGLRTGEFVEAGMLGRNGVVGAGAALDGPIALNTAIIQADSAGR